MEQRIEAVARALCAVDKLDPDALVATPDYSGELRSGNHSDVPQWQTKAREAARFLAMLDALMPSGLLPPGRAEDTMVA